MATIYFTVTNDLNTDQRMIRICSSLVADGHTVLLIGRHFSKTYPIQNREFDQKRLFCFFKHGFLAYAEFNLRLFLFLFFSKKPNLICAIDLDTILPCLWISQWKKIKRVYDAHELFCEMKEVAERPRIHRFWKSVEKYALPKFKDGYTVNGHISEEFRRMYGLEYAVVRSMSKTNDEIQHKVRLKKIIYQGAVNQGRCFEALIPAMKNVDAELHIYGTGNFITETKLLVIQNALEEKVIFHGIVSPDELKKITPGYYVGITLFESGSKSNYFSLANRFFDYLHARVPQLASDFPVYKEMNNQHEIALLISDLSPNSIADHLNMLLRDEALWMKLHHNCSVAAAEWNWEKESEKLIQFYRNVLA